MSEAVDTRIVEAKFDSAQFEKGVDRTVKKLDELKKSLNLEESGKSITDLASKTESATDKAASALEKLENRFTTFTGMLKQKILSGIADEIVGALFKIKNGFENLVRSISSGQMQYGMQRYSDLLTSVRTMTAAGVDQNLAYEAIGKLSEYADQTSYSLDQLVSTMSKFRTAGADLMTAERMVMGLSNAAASMGVNAQQASRAYLNMQQAYSKGFMQQNDWISFESLPMVGEKFNQAIIDAAVKMKTLKKEADGTYKTIKEGDKQVVTGGAASKGITAQNMGTKLASKWFNKAVMEEVFGSMYYFSATDDETIREIKKKESALKAKIGKIDAETGELYTNEMFEKEFEAVLKDIEQEKLTEKTEELNKALEEGRITQEQYTKALNDFTKSNVFSKFGWDAFRAGQEARSFADVINMLKDVISRGWSQSFEIIFGKLDEASDFFTKLADNEIINAIRSIIDFRNAILQHWRDYGGRDSMIEALENINEVIGSILGNFTIFYSDSDDFEDKTTKIGHALGAATDRFRDFTIQLKTWVTENQDKISHFVETMRKIKDTVALVIGAITTVLGIGFDFFKRLFIKLDPVFKSIEKAIEQVFGPIEELLDPKKDVEGKNTGSAYVALADALDNILVAADPLIKILPGVIEILAKIGTFLVEVGSNVIMSNLQFIGETLGLIIDIFGGNSAQSQRGEGTFDKLSDNIERLGEACKSAIQAVSEFFSALIQDLRRFFGVAGETDGKEGGAFAGLKEFFNTNEFIQSVKAKIKDLPNKIKSLFWKNGFSEEVYKQIARWDTKSAQQYKNAFKGPLTKILEALAKAIKDFIKQIPSKVTNVWNSIIDFIFGKKQEVTKIDKDGNLVTKTERVKEGFSKWLDDTIQVIKDWIKSIPQKIAGVWSNITGYFFNDEGGFDNSAFDQWLHNLIDSVKEWFENNFKPTIVQVWTEVKAFIFGREAFEGWRENEDTGEMEYVTEKARKGIVNWLIELPGKIRKWFDENSEEMLSHVKKLWNTVIDFIFGKKVEPDEIDSGKIDENATIVNGRIKEGFSLWLFNLKEKAKTWTKSFQTTIKEIWDTLIGAIFGNNEKTDEEKDQIDKKFGSVEEAYKNNLGRFGSILRTPPMDKKSEEGGAIIESVKRFAENLGTEIAKIISDLPATIAEKVDFGLSLAGTLFENINQWLEKINTDEYKESFEENIESFKKAIQEGDTSGLSPFAVKVIEIGQKIRSFITETIPGIISGGYHFISDESGNLLSAILALFDIKDWSKVEAKAQDVGEEIAKKIKQIPEYIRLGAESIKNIFTKTRNAGYSETEQAILDQFTDEQGRLAMTTEFRAAMEKSADQIAKEKEGWTIWGVISDIGVAIGDAFIGLGPTILQGINSVITWIGDGMTKVGDWLKGKPSDVKLTDYIDEQVELPENEQYKSIWESAKTLGSTIVNVFTQVIPDFLSTAFNTIVTDLPNIIGQAFGGANVQEETAKAVETAIGPATPGSASGGGFDLWSFLGGSVAGADEAVSEFGETLDTVNEETEKAVKKTKQIVNKQEELQKLNKERDKLAHEANMSIAGVGQTNAGSMAHNKKFKELLDQVEAYDEYIEAVKKLEEDQNGNVDIGGLDAEALKKQGGMFADIGGVVEQFANFATSDTTKAIAIIIGIGYILSQIKEVMSIADELESFSDTLKWTALTVLISGIVAILGYITYLASQDTPESDTFENVIKVFENLGSFVEKLAWIIGGIELLSLFKSIADWRTAADELKAETGGTSATMADKLGVSFLNKLLGVVTTILGAGPAGEAIGNGVANLFEGLTEAAQDIGTGVSSMLNMLEPGIEKLVKLNTDLDSALSAFGKLEELLGKFKEILQGKGFAGWGGGGEQNDAYMQQVHDFLSDVMEVPDEQNIQNPGAFSTYSSDGQPVKSIEKRLEWLHTLTDFMYEIGHSLEAIAKVENPTEAMKNATEIFGSEQFMTMLQSLFGGLSSMAGYFSEDLSDGGLDLKVAGQNMRFFADAMSIFAGSISTLSYEQLDVVSKGLDVIRELVGLVSGNEKYLILDNNIWQTLTGSGDKTISAFGRSLMSFGGSMSTFFGYVDRLSSDSAKTEQLSEKLDLVLITARSFAYIADKISNEIGQKNKLEALSEIFADLGKLGENLTGFIDKFSKYETNTLPDISFIVDSLDIIKRIVDILFVQMNGLDFNNVNEEYTKHYEPRLKMIMKIIQEVFQMFGEIYKMLKQDADRPDLNVDIFKDDAYTTLVESLRYYMTLIEDVVSIMERMKTISYTEDDNPFHMISDSVNILNADFDTISQFVEKVKTLNADDLKSAVSLFQGLESLANAIKIFSGDTYETGVDNLRLFNWDGLIKSLSDNMIPALSSDRNVFNEFGEMVGKNIVAGLVNGVQSTVDDAKKSMQDLANAISENFTMKLESFIIGDNEERKYTITPVLNMTDQFISDVNTMRSMFSVNPITKTPDGWTIPDYTSKLATQIELPPTLDSNISDMKEYMRVTSEKVSDFNNSLRSTRFIIDGQEFAAIVGDDIDQYLGRNGIYVVRNSGTG